MPAAELMRCADLATTVHILIESAEGVRKQRALARDGDAFAPFWAMWAAQEDALLAVEHTPERADIVIAS